MALGVVAVWQVISHRAHEHVDAAVDFTARINESLIVHDIDHRIAALDRLARRTRTSGQEQRSAWEADATRYIRDMPGFEAIVWADSSLQTRWVVSLAGDETTEKRLVDPWLLWFCRWTWACLGGGMKLMCRDALILKPAPCCKTAVDHLIEIPLESGPKTPFDLDRADRVVASIDRGPTSGCGACAES